MASDSYILVLHGKPLVVGEPITQELLDVLEAQTREVTRLRDKVMELELESLGRLAALAKERP
jgi:hypothetical protein